MGTEEPAQEQPMAGPPSEQASEPVAGHQPGSVPHPRAPAGAGKPVKRAGKRRRFKQIATIVGAAAGVVAALLATVGYLDTRNERGEAQTQVIALAEQVNELSVDLGAVETERDRLDDRIDDLTRERDQLREELERVQPGGPIEPTPSLGEPPPPGTTYLADEELLDRSDAETGDEQVRGVVYPHSVLMSLRSCSDAAMAYAEFDLALAYERLTATVGFSDKNELFNRTAKFEVFLDNELAYEATLAGGAAEPVDISVSDKLRMRLQVTFYRPQDCSRFHWSDRVVWGDAALRS